MSREVNPTTDKALWKDVRSLCLVPSAPNYDVVTISDALVHIVEKVGEEAFPEYIAAAVEDGIFDAQEGALLLGIATYATDDEGARIRRVLESWLEAAADRSRVAMALDEGTVPFRSGAHRVKVLSAVASRFPELAERCRYLIETYPHD